MNEDKNAKKIALMGGTFNPIHFGHLIAAETVRQKLGVDQVIFIPAGAPPHKDHRGVTNKEHRFEMTSMAIQNNPFFHISRMEIDRDGPSYTIDTIKEMKRRYGGEILFYFITGADAVNEILSWKKAEQLLGMCRFVAVTRPGYDNSSLIAQVEKIKADYHSAIEFLEIPLFSISSSDIRTRICLGRSIRYLTPDAVKTYIEDHELYQNISGVDTAGALGHMKAKMSKKRYNHIIGVSEVAVQLAGHYGLSSEKACIAGIFHDYAKEFSEADMVLQCVEYGLEIDEFMLASPDLLHGPLSAEIAKEKYGVIDEDILNAIWYHTTGREGMSRLEKILFLADLLEPGREKYDHYDSLKKMAFEDLNEAMIMALDVKIKFTAQRGRKLHPLSGEAMADMKKKQGRLYYKKELGR